MAASTPAVSTSSTWTTVPVRSGSRPSDLPLSDVDPDRRLTFVALLVDDDQACTTGIVAVAAAFPGEALGIVRPLAGGAVALTAQRWTRGGRR
jgi:uncharacterized protein